MADQPAFKLFKAARVIDSISDRPIENGAVLVEGTKIVQVGMAKDVAAPEGASVEEHNFSNGTLLPGLIDVHCHFNYPGDGTHTDDVMDQPDDILLMRSVVNTRTHLESGVTTARENGAKHDTSFSLREGIRMGLAKGPRLMVCGNPVTITGGHMWQMGGEADGVDGVRTVVRRLIKKGANWIKVPVTGGSSKSSFPYRSAYTLEELTALCDEAHRFDLLVGAHSRLTKTIIQSLDAGVDMIIHGGFQEEDQSWVFRPDVAERMVKAGMCINTTIHIGRARTLILRGMAETGEEAVVHTERSPIDLDKAERDFESRMEQIRQLIDIGVVLVPGTDSGFGWYPFGGFQYELECLDMAGMSPMKVIQAATRQASEAIAVSDIVGTLEKGKEADLLVVTGNPAQDIKALHNVEAVFQGGVQVR